MSALQERGQYQDLFSRLGVPPTMTKRIVVSNNGYKFRPDGTINPLYWVRGPAPLYDPRKDETVIFFQGTEPRFKEPTDPPNLKERKDSSGVFAVKVSQSVGEEKFLDTSGNVVKRDEAIPLFVSSNIDKLAPDGQQNPRATHFAEGTFFSTNFVVVSSFNRSAYVQSRIEAGTDKSIPLQGVTPVLYIVTRPEDPTSYVSLGSIGPNEYFKNIFIHPSFIEKDGDVQVLLYGRKYPGIQGYCIPFRDFPRLVNDPDFRNHYWEHQLKQPSIKSNTILEPLFEWESKGNKFYPEGQIAGGGPPVAVSYTDTVTDKETRAWLLLYNAVPYFDERGRAKGRVVGAALLAYDDPYTVLHRSPVPILYPTEDVEVDKGRFRNVTYATGAYIDKRGMLKILYSAGDSVISEASCPVNEMTEFLTRFNNKGQII